jgi:enamine deaminase RidA (YjgF/YER057c/UK114 family)
MLSRHSFTQFLRRGAAPAGAPTTTTTTMTMTPIGASSRRIPPFTAQAVGTRFLHIEKRIEELGFQLPPPAPPRANYNSVCWSSGGTVLYLSGHLPFNTAGTELTKGRIGEGGRDVEYGYQAARQVALGLVATLKDQLGDLDRVEQIVKVSLGRDGCVLENVCHVYM